jgi:hypothetical protein
MSLKLLNLGLNNNSIAKIPIYNNTFTFEISLTVNTTAGKTFTIPTNNAGASYSHNFVIDWGDGGAESNITSYNDADRTHVYTSTGTYQIIMAGLCEAFSFNNINENNSILKITKMISFTGDMGFKKLSFYGCSNLNTIVPLGNFASLTSAVNTFRNCISITSIPSGMFDNCIAVTIFESIFMGCSALTAIVSDLFKYNTAVTIFSGIFNGCNNISLISIPNDIFRYNIGVREFSGIFASCIRITSLNANLFQYNTLVTDFNNAFSGCIGLTTVPSLLFKYNTEATTFLSTFSGCKKLQLNDTIFYSIGDSGTRFLNQSVDFNQCFYRSTFTGTQGTAPDLWNCNFGTGTPTKTSCFAGAGNSLTSLDNYASIPSAWGSTN